MYFLDYSKKRENSREKASKLGRYVNALSLKIKKFMNETSEYHMLRD